MFKFNEAISFQVNCETQKEVDYYWGELSKGMKKRKCAAACRINTADPGKSFREF
jgi:predicted 3-demethylubiquinone-9 3-methyltransferase (glyoxalase superfamily)